jgi:peptidoglycan/LPS O-acetylase OafA/YrhL
MKYRSELDGIRAIAVLPVILFHIGPKTLSGGFLGVDVFFVISGYLIATMIYEDIFENRFSILKFYDRRIRRILPPLLLTAILTILISGTFSPADIKNTGQAIIATFSFLSNYYFYLKTDYFNNFNEISPLLHTWSLSIEEQFYLVFPIAFVIIIKTKNALMFLVILALISFFSYLNEKDEILLFYSIHTRGWELLVGAVIAVFDQRFPKKINGGVSEIVTAFMFIGLILCFIFLDNFVKPRWFVNLLPVLLTGGVIYFSQFSEKFKFIIGNRLLAGIGKISYPLYLYHNPVFSGVRYNANPPNFEFFAALCLPGIFLMAYLSNKYIEVPSRSLNKFSLKQVYITIITILIILFGFGYAAHKTAGFLEFFRDKLIRDGGVSLVDVDKETRLVDDSRKKYSPSDLEFSCIDHQRCTNILLFGDSFSEDAYLSLQTLNISNLSVRRVNFDDECMGITRLIPTKCQGAMVDFGLVNQADVILISAKWQQTTFHQGFEFANILSSIAKKPVYVIGSVMFEDMSSFVYKTKGTNGDLSKISKLAYSNQRFDRLRISNKLRALVLGEEKLRWIEKHDFFCSHSDQTCNLIDQNGPVIWDMAHLTTRSYVSYGRFLMNQIKFEFKNERNFD